MTELRRARPAYRRAYGKRGVPVQLAAAQAKHWEPEWIYFAGVFACWCFVPLARRLLDWHSGAYNPIQVTSTIPFLATLPLALVALRRARLAKVAPAFRFFAWVWVASFAYGFVVALYGGNTFAALYEAIQYLVPMLVGVWLVGVEVDNDVLLKRLSLIVLPLSAIVALYGLAQFVTPAPWDVLWVEGSQFASVGSPTPFAMRIFATLNSPGPAADFFVATLLLTVPLLTMRKPWIWPLAAVLAAALLLTLVRESWIGLLVGAVAYLCLSPRRWRAIPVLTILGVVVAMLIGSLPAILGAGPNGDVVSARLSTLTDVAHDESALARTHEIQDAIDQGLRNPVGAGLGNIGASSALSSNPDSAQGNNLDSGYMARFLELGWPGFAGYLVVLFGSLGAMVASVMFRRSGRAPSVQQRVMIATAASVCAALAWGDAAGDSHLGLDGFFYWIAMGIGFRR